MLQNNCRIENLNGLRFYEQDILFDDYVYSGDILITLKAKYFNSGIGIAFINSEGLSIKDKSELYLFRIGSTEASVIYKKENVTKRILRNSINITIPNEDLTFKLKKSGKVVTLYLDNQVVFSTKLPTRIDSYNLGIYSSAGNIINNLSIASNIPDSWIVNMANTNGGYIKFLNDGFSISDCKNDAQLVQESIHLSAGTYYLKYSAENSDIKPYIYYSNDERIFDEEKNILNSNGSFTLDLDSDINLKFSGTNGTIKYIHISNYELDKYIATKNGNVSIDGSYVTIHTKDDNNKSIKSAEWKGVIYNTPDEIHYDTEFFVIKDNVSSYTLSDLGILKGVEYSYYFDVASSVLTISKDGAAIRTLKLLNVTNLITIFKNVDATITNFIITDSNNVEVIITVQNDLKKYVSNNISGPIIAVTTNYNEETPLNLSSSYRIFNNGSYDEYIFTNVEREVFEASTILKVENKISDIENAVKIYGVRYKDKCDLDNIFRIKERDIDNISSFTNNYVVLDSSYIYLIRTSTGEIFLNEAADIEQFELFVVDYIKKDSYCINENYDSSSYEVSVSPTDSYISLIYESSLSDESEKSLTTITKQKNTGIIIDSNKYIVLRKGI